MNLINLDETTAREVHATIGRNDTQLARMCRDAKVPSGASPIEWQVPITSQTVHYAEGLMQLAEEAGVPVSFEKQGSLNPREAVFWSDFQDRRLSGAGQTAASLWDKVEEVGALAAECVSAAWYARRFGKATPLEAETSIPTALLIGAYGGEHIGDAAILGGVLRHLSEDYGTRHVHLMSLRPDHTTGLAATLDTSIEVSVHSYNMRVVDSLMDESDGLVYAGGPLMDLPRMLVRHIAAFGSAARKGRPVVMDGIGVGPFRRQVSEYAARHIAKRASKISVRTPQDAVHSVLSGLSVDVARDPAFDYLETRDELTQLSDQDRDSVDALLSGSQDHMRVGINLRPIRLDWSSRGSEFAKASEEQFFDRLAESLVSFAANSERQVTYFFFPMNPMQMGSSDFAAAYKLHRLIGRDADLRVWEADPDIDGVLYFLRQLDCALAMRFHACIFAISQSLPVLGIDYYPGDGGKVEQLFGSLGRPSDVSRIDTYSGDWMIGRLREITLQGQGRKRQS